MRAHWTIWLLVISSLCASGCSRAIVAPNPFEIDASEYSRMHQAAIEVLREYGFTVDQHDYRFGQVVSQPRQSPTLLEVWDPANTTLDQAIQSSVVDVRRRVRVTLEPMQVAAEAEQTSELVTAFGDPLGPSYALAVEVQLEQRQTPTQYTTGSTRGGRIVAQLRTVPAELAQRGIEGAYWQPIGRDEALEQRLVAAIVRRSIEVTPPMPTSSTTALEPLPDLQGM